MDAEKHHIVAIGASAGGLEAIHEFFDNTSEQVNVSYVIIQHLSPDYKSLLVELVSRHTDMKVFEAEDSLTVERSCVYVIPNNKMITIRNDQLMLEDKRSIKAPNNAVDIFLHSLAREKKQNAIAVILSGTGTDGTRGIEEIKKHGGLVIVQDPLTAKFDGMPNSAIHSGNVDFVLAPAKMHEEIANYTRDRSENGALDKVITDELLQKIFTLIQRAAGLDFNYYKTPTIIRRIHRRLLRGEFRDIQAYVDFLEKNDEECRQLGRDFLIGVTKFFRDASAFEYLKGVLSQVVDEKHSGDVIKIWVSACSTGEEAYSLAIMMNEVLEEKGRELDVKIFATDLEQSNIDIASRGIYPPAIEKDVDPQLLQKYFVRSGKSFVILPRIRKQIVFTVHNIVKDPPFIKNDLVTCRNMLIYMNPILQNKVYALLLFSVKRDGYLFFGSSENPTYLKDSVIELHPKHKIYRKISESKYTGAGAVEISPSKSKTTVRHTGRTSGDTTGQSKLWEDFRKVLGEELTFAALYVDQNYEVKEAIGNYEKILTLPRKTLRMNILRMVPQGLSSVLNPAINKVWKSNKNLLIRNVRYEDQGALYHVQLLIKPAEEITGCTLVVFSHFNKVEESAGVYPAAADDNSNTEYIRSLENELMETKNNLQVVVEDLETVNEELQSSNEELLSANEELQSSNEELQSLNEELHTLNTEHQQKIKELLELNDDLNNYFRSTDIGQIFVTKDIRIRKFNPASARMINFIESDLGRPLTHISTNIRYNNLINDVQQVIEKNVNFEREVQLNNGRTVLLRILPYVTRDKKNDGVIISFVDITMITNLNNIIRAVLNSSQNAIIAFQAVRDEQFQISDFTVLTANHTADAYFKLSDDSWTGRSMKRDLPQITINGLFKKYMEVVLDDVPLNAELFLENEDRWYSVSAAKMADGLVTTFTNITEKKQAEQRLKKNYVELVSVKDNLKKLNLDLESKIRERTKELSESEERFRIVSQATNDGIWDWNFVHNRMWWGEGFYKLFGYKASAEVMSRNFWFSNIHKDDAVAVQTSLQDVIQSGAKQWSCEYRFQKADGTYAHILDRGYVLHDEYDTPYRMIGSMLDITSLKKAEQEVRSNIQQREFLAESMPLIVATARPDFSIDFFNNHFETYSGIPAERALGQGWTQLIHSEDLPALLQAGKAGYKRKSDFEREVRVKHYTGDYLWNIFRAKVRLGGKGELLSWVITIIDIHSQKMVNENLERKVAERTLQLREINEALEASNHDLQQFASVASHDLQEPLRKIHMFSKLIRDKHIADLNKEGVHYLEKIMQASNRMKSIITNVLNFSRLSSDDNRFETVNLKHLVTELLEDLEVTIKERNATVELKATCNVEVIPGQIRQVFQNLISNSLKFCPAEVAPVITIESETVNDKSFTAPQQRDGNYCRIRISDNGIGFDDKFKENIFTLFHRLHSKDAYEGTGIGLAIVKKIIEKHNGIITATSAPGKGAEFTIVLPVTPVDVPKNETVHYG